jgi:hypothetical protein
MKILFASLMLLALSATSQAAQTKIYCEPASGQPSIFMDLSKAPTGELNGEFVDNFSTARVTCAPLAQATFRCIGHWRNTSNAEVAQATLSQQADGKWVAEFMRPSRVGNETLKMVCE